MHAKSGLRVVLKWKIYRPGSVTADVMLLMGHELIIYGVIEGATGSADDYRRLQRLNEDVIGSLHDEDVWPWLTRPMFQLPAENPSGTYQTQKIRHQPQIGHLP